MQKNKMKKLIEMLKRHEGVETHAYECSEGKITVGVGRNIDQRGGIGLSEDEVEYLLENDIERVIKELAESKDPLVIEAIQKSIRNAELIDLEMMIKSIELLAKYGDTESISALTSALKKSESKIMDLREVIVNAISENGSDDHHI